MACWAYIKARAGHQLPAFVPPLQPPAPEIPGRGGSFGAFYLLPWLLPGSKHPLDERGPLLSAYALVLVGVAAHLLVDFWKRRSERTLGVVVLSYWQAWLMLHSLSLWKLLMAPVATTVLLRWLKISLDADGWATYVLAGYSADSIGDLALARLKTLRQSDGQHRREGRLTGQGRSAETRRCIRSYRRAIGEGATASEENSYGGFGELEHCPSGRGSCLIEFMRAVGRTTQGRWRFPCAGAAERS